MYICILCTKIYVLYSALSSIEEAGGNTEAAIDILKQGKSYVHTEVGCQILETTASNIQQRQLLTKQQKNATDNRVVYASPSVAPDMYIENKQEGVEECNNESPASVDSWTPVKPASLLTLSKEAHTLQCAEPMMDEYTCEDSSNALDLHIYDSDEEIHLIPTPHESKSTNNIRSEGKKVNSSTRKRCKTPAPHDDTLGSKIILAPVYPSACLAKELGLSSRDLIASPCRRTNRFPQNNNNEPVTQLLEKLQYNYAPNYALNVYAGHADIGSDDDDAQDVFSKYLPLNITPLSTNKKRNMNELEEAVTSNRRLDFDEFNIVPVLTSNNTDIQLTKYTPRSMKKRKCTPRPNPLKKGEVFRAPDGLLSNPQSEGETRVRRSSRLSITPKTLRKKMEQMLMMS